MRSSPRWIVTEARRSPTRERIRSVPEFTRLSGRGVCSTLLLLRSSRAERAMTHDTEPDSAPAPSVDHDASERTEPGPPPSDVVPPRPTGLAADLLDHLSDIPLPENGIAETKGHDAARFAVAPHSPPRRAQEQRDGPSVLVNVTAPLAPLPPAAVPLVAAPPYPSVADAERTVLTRDRREAPEPKEEPKGRSVAIAISIGIVAVAALIAAAIVMPREKPILSTEPSPSPSGTPSPSATSATAPPPSTSATVGTPAISASAVGPAQPPPAHTPSSRPLSSSTRNPSPSSAPASAPTPTTSYNRFLEDDRK